MEQCILTFDEVRRISEFLRTYEPLDAVERACAARLASKLATATVVPHTSLPRTAVSMFTTAIALHLVSGETHVHTLVYPPQARELFANLSLLSPEGVALLGASEGTTVGDGATRLSVTKVLHQPEWMQRNRFTHSGYHHHEVRR